jgi:hypothetical protein
MALTTTIPSATLITTTGAITATYPPCSCYCSDTIYGVAMVIMMIITIGSAILIILCFCCGNRKQISRRHVNRSPDRDARVRKITIMSTTGGSGNNQARHHNSKTWKKYVNATKSYRTAKMETATTTVRSIKINSKRQLIKRIVFSLCINK